MGPAVSPIDDFEFDRVYPLSVRRLSRAHWTPVHVAALGADWLQTAGARQVLDVGSGVGKFCIVAAHRSPAVISGVEHRRALIDVAREAAAVKRAPVEFLHAAVHELDATRFDGFYAYNPFDENLASPDGWIDSEVELSEGRFWRDIRVFDSWLRAAPKGAALVTFHSLGGWIPGSFAVHRQVRIGAGWLRLWVKERLASAEGDFYLEFGNHVVHSSQLRALQAMRSVDHPLSSNRIQLLLKLESDEPKEGENPCSEAHALDDPNPATST